MDLETSIRKRVSVRQFREDPVDEVSLQFILEMGTRAPSPLNLQPWEFIIIREQKTKDALFEISCQARDSLAEKSKKAWVAKYDLTFLKKAPVLIVVLADQRKTGMGTYLGDTSGHIQATAACIENMLLAATSLGLGSIWLTMFEQAAIKQVLAIPENSDVAAVLPLGFPASVPGESNRVPVVEKSFRERYGKTSTE